MGKNSFKFVASFVVVVVVVAIVVVVVVTVAAVAAVVADVVVAGVIAFALAGADAVAATITNVADVEALFAVVNAAFVPVATIAVVVVTSLKRSAGDKSQMNVASDYES